MVDPLHQFHIEPIIPLRLWGIDVSFTNSSLFMVFAVLGIFALFATTITQGALVPGRLQSVGEVLYEFITNMINETIGSKGIKYFPFIFSLFLFVLFGNLLGMLPYSFTFTSHIIVTFALALMVFVAVTLVGFARHGFHFLSLFCPKGIPLVLAPLMILVELISYMVRPISLSVRLFANMLAGHMVLKLFVGFILAMGLAGGFVPYVFSIALFGFEIFVCLLQAYIFTILTCVYFNDAINLH